MKKTFLKHEKKLSKTRKKTFLKHEKNVSKTRKNVPKTRKKTSLKHEKNVPKTLKKNVSKPFKKTLPKHQKKKKNVSQTHEKKSTHTGNLSSRPCCILRTVALPLLEMISAFRTIRLSLAYPAARVTST